jgi:NCS2 family nucleobase:cation symporter-2
LVAISAIKSRWVTAVGGIILPVLGLIPKLGALITAVPLFVLGGAGIVMFGMVAATGIRILASIEYKNRNNVFIVAISIGFGMIPLVAPSFFAALPRSLAPMLNSGIVLAAVTSVLLNLFFNGTQRVGHSRGGR